MSTNTSRMRRILTTILTYAVILVVTLLAIDGICIAFGLFPPTLNYGDPDLGWRPSRATGRMAIGKCLDFSTGETIIYQRNEDGVRTSLSKDEILRDSTRLRIGVTGDSHTDLCASNAALHSGVLEAALDSAGVPSTVLSYGAGRYSPLQAYLAFKKVLAPYRPQVLILNLYTGNDFYDILRADDRPHFVAADTGYRIVGPDWYALDDPTITSRSRVRFAVRELGDRLGVRGLYFRVSELQRLGAEHGEGLPTVLAYMRDVWKAREPSVGYPDAFTAQFLNQQLFFHHFPGSRDESLRRVSALMALMQRENPELLLVMSPLPSYELVGASRVDTALTRTLARLPLTYDEGIRQEGLLYEHLRQLAGKDGWTFVDNLSVLRAYQGPEPLYNDFDYHLLPAASALIGRAQAVALIEALNAR